MYHKHLCECLWYEFTVNTSHYGNESLLDLPRGWSWCKLYDVCIFESGFAFKSDSYKKSGVPLVRISNIQDNAIVLDECVYIQERVDSRYHIQKGDLLIALSGATTGKMGVYQHSGDALLNQRVGNLRVLSPNCFTPEYRNLFLSSKEDEILKKAWGGAQPNISPSTICDFDIPLPPINEQRRIVLAVSKYTSILDCIYRNGEEIEFSIDKTKARILELAVHGKLVPQNPAEEPAIELLRRINPSFTPSDNLHYKDALPTGWTLCRLEDILDYEQPQAYIVKSTEYSDSYSTPVLTPGKSFILGYTNESDGVYKTLPVIIFDDFTTESKYVDFPFKVKSSAMKILRPRGEIDIRYVAFFMSITKLAGDTHKRYWISEYSKLCVPLPPLEEQRRIVAKITKINEQLELLIADTL